LEELWPTVKGYFNIEKGSRLEHRSEDAEVVAQLQRVYLIADANGNALGYNEDNDSISFSTAEIRLILADSKTIKRPPCAGTNRGAFSRRGWLGVDDHRQRYFLAIGGRFPQQAYRVLPRSNVFSFAPGAHRAGNAARMDRSRRAIRPLNLVVQAAQNITGSNLSLQIPQRGAGDELDHLIESFNLMTARLNQSFEQIRRFSTDVSHELRTPLTSIRGNSKWLSSRRNAGSVSGRHGERSRRRGAAFEYRSRPASTVAGRVRSIGAPENRPRLSKLAIEMVDQFQIPAQEKQIVLTALASPGCVIHADERRSSGCWRICSPMP